MTVEPPPVEARGRVRRWFAAGASLVIVLASVVLVAVVASGDDADDTSAASITSLPASTVPITAFPTTTVPATTQPAVTTSPVPVALDPAVPKTTVVVRSDREQLPGRTTTHDHVLLVDTATGRVVRELRDAGDRQIAGIAVSADGSVVYFAEMQGGVGATADHDVCGPTLYRVPADGGVPERVAEGIDPAVSPDGRFLAYVANAFSRGGIDGRSTYCGLFAVVVRNQVTGVETVSLPSDEHGHLPELNFLGAGGLSWSPDSTRLAYEAGDEGGNAMVIDLATGQTREVAVAGAAEREARDRFGRCADSSGISTSTPRWTAGGDLVVAIWCYGSVGQMFGVVNAAFLAADPAEIDSTIIGRASGATLRRVMHATVPGPTYDVVLETSAGSVTLVNPGSRAAWPSALMVVP
jgi:hypothetical protein